MGAPTHTTRTAPLGIPMDDGFSTKIALSVDPDVSFWEVTVQPPGVDGGDPIETTTMHNVTWRTFSTRQLKTLTSLTVNAAYDPILYDQILAVVNVEGMVTVHFPDGSQLSFFGAVQSFTPQEHSEGAQPRAQIIIVPTNVDEAGDEQSPVLANVPGT